MSEKTKTAKDFFTWSDTKKKEYIEQHYLNSSFPQIARQIGTYGKKIEREAKRLGIKIHSKSEAQKIAYAQGNKKHPTKGTTRPENVKLKISEKIGDYWDHIDTDEYHKRQQMARDRWQNRTEEEKSFTEAKRIKALQKTTIIGSKLERSIAQILKDEGYTVEQHKKNMIVNQEVHLDLYLPRNNIAIEIDGPSHRDAVWGDSSLNRQQRTDKEKEFLLLSKGINLIRVKHNHKPSKRRIRQITSRLLTLINTIKTKHQQNIEGQLFIIED